MNCVVKLRFLICLQLETKYFIALSPNSYGRLVYKLHTSKVTKAVSSVTFCLHVFKNSKLSLMLFLKCLVKDFKMRSKKVLNLLVGHFVPPNIGLSFKSLGSEMAISSLLCSLLCILLYIKFSICVFQDGHKSYLYIYSPYIHVMYINASIGIYHICMCLFVCVYVRVCMSLHA